MSCTNPYRPAFNTTNEIANALKLLKIPKNEILNLEFKKLDGTRQVIQYKQKDYVLRIAKLMNPELFCYGITNRTEDMQYIFFADYDDIYYDLLIKNLKNLLKKFPDKFTNFFIIQSGEEQEINGSIVGSYHAINFAKTTKEEIQKYLKLCDVDNDFIDIATKTEHKTQVLRISPKFYKSSGLIFKPAPKFKAMFPEKIINNKTKNSNAHYYVYHTLIADFPKITTYDFDDYGMCEFHHYQTPLKTKDNKSKRHNNNNKKG